MATLTYMRQNRLQLYVCDMLLFALHYEIHLELGFHTLGKGEEGKG